MLNIKQVSITESENDYLACLTYQINGYMNLIRHICQAGGADGEQYQAIISQHQELCIEKELVFKAICERYVPDYSGDEYNIMVNTNISALIVRKKVTCGQCN